ncbi:hypothetical protein Acr_00g0057580 [Actinidia rufa]|uniref:Reverse transcriptase domain-containing protein n=1 Tax=Actinidia rufa TaxID=165716 RepID=A0A7J0DN54_9ERIC|nr:hypothetical protein Acr_00g0057580 [Actinidia rufa]
MNEHFTLALKCLQENNEIVSLPSSEGHSHITIIESPRPSHPIFGVRELHGASPTLNNISALHTLHSRRFLQFPRLGARPRHFIGTKRAYFMLQYCIVPKVPNSSSMNEYRPISCCNTVYKVISKLLTNRLKAMGHYMISSCQSAFILGSIGLPDIFRKWIEVCITTPKFSISINGASHGYFPGAKGLRQGVPCLFILVMKFFSRILHSHIIAGQFSFHPKCHNLEIRHICFVDDLLILCSPDYASFHIVHHAVLEFHKFSCLSPGKSKVYFDGIPEQVKVAFCGFLGFLCGTLPVRYLGVPLISTKLIAGDCSPLIDKITTKTKQWANKSLSYAGHLQIIRAIRFNKVSFVSCNDVWTWPFLSTGAPPYQPKPHLHDSIVWSISPSSQYHATSTWNALRSHHPRVVGHKLVWFPKLIPRHSFILWMAIRGKLRTKDKLSVWRVTADAK